MKIEVGLIGMGTVGGGVVEAFEQGWGQHRFQDLDINLKRVAVKNPSKMRTAHSSASYSTVVEILDDPAIDIVVELMGGQDLAREYMISAIDQGKSVVTGNKAVVSRHMKDLFDAARSRKVDFGFEGSVGGGIPIVRPLMRLRSQGVARVMSIINGTSNYILSRMEEGMGFDGGLSLAQEHGFAEADHTLDTGGFDSRDKLAIVSSIISNCPVNPEDIHCEGIASLNEVDIDFAQKYGIEEGEGGYAIKLLAVANLDGNDLEAHVYPALLKRDHPLASVRDQFNAVFVESTWAGPQMFMGKGAGSQPTASSVLEDIAQVAWNKKHDMVDELPTLDRVINLVDIGTVKRRGYLRADLKHIPGSRARIDAVLEEHGINIEDQLNKIRFKREIGGEVFIPDAITFEALPYAQVRRALEEIAKSDRIEGSPVFLRFEE